MARSFEGVLDVLIPRRNCMLKKIEFVCWDIRVHIVLVPALMSWRATSNSCQHLGQRLPVEITWGPGAPVGTPVEFIPTW